MTTFGIEVCWFELFIYSSLHNTGLHNKMKVCKTPPATPSIDVINTNSTSPRPVLVLHSVSSEPSNSRLWRMRLGVWQSEERHSSVVWCYGSRYFCMACRRAAGWIGCSYWCLVDWCSLWSSTSRLWSFFILQCKSQYEPQVSSRSRVISELPLTAFFKCGTRSISSMGMTAMNVELKSTNSILILFYNICMKLMLMCLLLNETAIKTTTTGAGVLL